MPACVILRWKTISVPNAFAISSAALYAAYCRSLKSLLARKPSARITPALPVCEARRILFVSEGLTTGGFCGILSSRKSSPLAPFRVFTSACKVRRVEDSFLLSYWQKNSRSHEERLFCILYLVPCIFKQTLPYGFQKTPAMCARCPTLSISSRKRD